MYSPNSAAAAVPAIHQSVTSVRHVSAGLRRTAGPKHGLKSGDRDGATVLKVGGANSASEVSRIFLTPPLFGQWGDKILLR